MGVLVLGIVLVLSGLSLWKPVQLQGLANLMLDDYLQRLDTSDADEHKAGGSRVKNLAEKIAAIRRRRTRCQEMLAKLDRTGADQISLTDPDSRAMAARTHVAVGYNVQTAVDTKHKLIVEQQVTNQVVDMGLLTETAAPAKEVLGVEQIAVVAGRRYFKIEDIEACEKAGMELIPVRVGADSPGDSQRAEVPIRSRQASSRRTEATDGRSSDGHTNRPLGCGASIDCRQVPGRGAGSPTPGACVGSG